MNLFYCSCGCAVGAILVVSFPITAAAASQDSVQSLVDTISVPNTSTSTTITLGRFSGVQRAVHFRSNRSEALHALELVVPEFSGEIFDGDPDIYLASDGPSGGNPYGSRLVTFSDIDVNQEGTQAVFPDAPFDFVAGTSYWLVFQIEGDLSTQSGESYDLDITSTDAIAGSATFIESVSSVTSGATFRRNQTTIPRFNLVPVPSPGVAGAGLLFGALCLSRRRRV